MLISPAYQELQRELHARRVGYGTHGHKWARDVLATARSIKAESILDYGCGAGTLGATVKLHWPQVKWQDYDPNIDAVSADPRPADLVVCGDVLEHIEEECLDDVLDHLKALARKAVFLVIATRPAKKTLADGRNAHLIVRPWQWWGLKIEDRWRLREIHGEAGEFLYIGEAK